MEQLYYYWLDRLEYTFDDISENGFSFADIHIIAFDYTNLFARIEKDSKALFITTLEDSENSLFHSHLLGHMSDNYNDWFKKLHLKVETVETKIDYFDVVK